MKKVFLAIPMILALSGCGSDIDLVKNGVMDFNQTTTVGQALDNWKSCKSREWEEFETDNGIKVVQFTCQHKFAQFMTKAKNLLPDKYQTNTSHLELASNAQIFQFTINQDNTFQLDNVQVETTWTDGTSFKDSSLALQQLETAYANKLNFDPTQLNGLVVIQISYMLAMMKRRAK